MTSGFLKDGCYLKNLEEPHIYDTARDEIYLLDEEAFRRILALHEEGAGDPEASRVLLASGLLQESARPGPVRVPGRSPDPSLRYLEIQITSRCDKTCLHCYLGSPGEQDMGRHFLQSILDQFAAMQGLKVMISGGEPACHPAFLSVTEGLSSRPLRAVLITHGEWIGPEEAGLLRERFHQVQVSLDGLRPGHDALRGRGSWDRAVAGLKALRKAGMPVSVATMAHEDNADEFERMSRFLKDLDVEEWSIDVPCHAGRWTRSGGGDPDTLSALSKKTRYAFGGGFHGGSRGLACGSHLMTVAPDGTAAKCGFYFDRSEGNAADGLLQAWRKIKHIPLERLDCDCELLEACAGGCRFRALTIGGSELAVDPVQCYARGLKQGPGE